MIFEMGKTIDFWLDMILNGAAPLAPNARDNGFHFSPQNARDFSRFFGDGPPSIMANILSYSFSFLGVM